MTKFRMFGAAGLSFVLALMISAQFVRPIARGGRVPMTTVTTRAVLTIISGCHQARMAVD